MPSNFVKVSFLTPWLQKYQCINVRNAEHFSFSWLYQCGHWNSSFPFFFPSSLLPNMWELHCETVWLKQGATALKNLVTIVSNVRQLCTLSWQIFLSSNLVRPRPFGESFFTTRLLYSASLFSFLSVAVSFLPASCRAPFHQSSLFSFVTYICDLCFIHK